MPKRGYKHSEATKARMRAAAQRRWESPEQREMISRLQKGRRKGVPLPEAARAALNLPDVQERRLAALREAAKRPDVMEKRSRATKRRLADPAAKAKHLAAISVNQTSAARRAWWAALTPERRERLCAARSRGQKARWSKLSKEERRQKLQPAILAGAAATRRMWASLTPAEKADKLAPVWAASQCANPSSIEETVASVLTALGIKHQRQVYIGRCLVDFYIRTKRLVIECDGSYWHSLPGRQESDASRDAWLISRGFRVLRLPEDEIRSGAAIDKLKEIA